MAFDLPSRFLLSVQHKLFYVVMSLARFNLYANSYSFLIKTARQRVLGKQKRLRGGRWTWWAEVLGLCVFWGWYGFGVLGDLKRKGGWKTAVGYLLVSHIVASPLHVQVNTFSTTSNTS